eukprot:Anaeramoba_ignava/c20210_g2_i2.p1 GENE.c20210_g2_i2~~c20210_g2_i2.p1  ORF type:complete len:188 (+),score=53.94 c20210_g2_i2:97-660(+)
MAVLKLVVVGSGAVGKSALSVQFVHSKFITDYEPTIEDSFRRQVEIDKEVCLLHILDTAGQEEFSIIRDTHLRVGDGYLLVFAIDNFTSFTEIPKFREKILLSKESSQVPFVIAANKCDLESNRKVSVAEAKDLAKSFSCPIFETSAKTRFNVDEVFFCLAREIRKIKNIDQQNVDNSKPQPKKKKK